MNRFVSDHDSPQAVPGLSPSIARGPFGGVGSASASQLTFVYFIIDHPRPKAAWKRFERTSNIYFSSAGTDPPGMFRDTPGKSRQPSSVNCSRNGPLLEMSYGFFFLGRCSGRRGFMNRAIGGILNRVGQVLNKEQFRLTEAMYIIETASGSFATYADRNCY